MAPSIESLCNVNICMVCHYCSSHISYYIANIKDEKEYIETFELGVSDRIVSVNNSSEQRKNIESYQ